MNVSKMRTGDRANRVRFYDVENLDFSYAYTELFNRNIDIEYHLRKTYRFSVGYTYQTNPKNYRPFSKINFLNKYKSLALIKDFNFYLSPRAMVFRSEMDREYQEQLMRNKTNAIILLEPNYMKTFNWMRFYNFKYDLTQSLKLDFTANAIARIDEPGGRISKYDSDYKEKRDSIWTNIMDFGRMTQYTQNYSLQYNVPINKIPLFNWVNLNTQYSGDYRWTASPLYKDSIGVYTEHPFGNTIENNRTISINAGANMTNLYNKIGYLRTLNQPQRPQPQRPQRPTQGRENTEEEPEEEPEEEKDPINYPKLIMDNTLKLLMSLKNVSGSYTQSQGTMLPGFKPTPTSLGMDWGTNAPGLGFIFGGQKDIRGNLAAQGLISTDSMMNMPHSSRYNENLNVRLTFEPIRTFRIEVSATRTYSLDKNEYYRFDNDLQSFRTFTPTENGNFSISIITWNTAFVRDAEDFSNQNFENFKEIRPQVANLIAQANPYWDGTYEPDPDDNNRVYPTGYNSLSQDVLITSFLTTYTGSDPSKYSANLFPQIPLPNWRINYNGLSQIEFFKEFFTSVTLMHAYRSTYSLGTFNSNVNYRDANDDGYTWVRDVTGNYIARYEIGVISINEQFAPLLNLDLKWKSGMTNRIDYKKSRNLSLGIANHQLTEVNSNEFIIGFGYIFRELPITIQSGGSTRTFQSDLNIKVDFSIRNNKTILRKITENYDQISAGQRVITINTSADYQLNERFMIRVFFDRIMNKPHISSQFPNSNTNAGVSVRFSLAQ
jgi:cell surface protein SprA